jgi:hypothetical protein
MYDYIPGMMPQGTGPQPTQDTQPTDLKGQWDSWLQNPVNRNALLGFGTQLMMGSWGSPIASALGAGIESAQGTEKLMQDEAIRQEGVANKLGEAGTEREFKAGENQLDRDAALDRTNIMAQSRETIAGNRGANNSAFNTGYRAKMQALQIPLLSGDISQEDAEQLAISAGQAAAAAAPTGYTQPGNSAAPGQGAPTNGVQAPSVGGTGQGGNAPAASPVAPKKGPSYDALITKYGAETVEGVLADPQKRSAFEAKFGKIEGVPASKGNVAPKFKGMEDGTKTAPFKSRDKAGAGDYYLKPNGKKARKGLFVGLEKEED